MILVGIICIGAFGIVYKGVTANSGMEIAIKTLKGKAYYNSHHITANVNSI